MREPEYEHEVWRYRCRALDVSVVIELDFDDEELAELADGLVVVTAWRDR